MTPEENKEIVRRSYQEGVNKGDADLALKDFDQNFLGHVWGRPEPVRGLEAFSQFVNKGLFAAFPDLHTDIQELLAVEDKVIVRHLWRGTQTAPFQGMPATGKEVEFKSIDIYRLENGRIMEEWVAFDMVDLLQQLRQSSK